MNLLTILAEFRKANVSDIEWHDETKQEYAYVRFQVHNAHEHYEVTITDRGDGNVTVTTYDLPVYEQETFF